jgi:ATP-binding cassette, subfamily B, bacterial
MFITVLASAVGLLTPWPMKILVDNVLDTHPLPAILSDYLGSIKDGRYSLLLFAIISGLVIALLGNLLTVINEYVQTKLDLSIVLDFRSDVFQHAQRLSMAYHDQHRAGGLIYAINFQGDAAARLIMTVPHLAQSVFTLVGMFWISYTIDRKLALISITVVPFLYLSVGYYIRNIQGRLQQVKGMEGESLSIIHEAVSMLRVIVAFGREGHEYQRFRKQGERAVNERVKLTVRQTFFSLVINTITAFGTALVLGFGAYHVMEGKLTIGQLLVVIAYIAAVYQPLEAISTTIGSLQDQIMSLKIAFDLLDTEPDIKDAPDAKEIKKARGSIAFEGVNFSYSGRVDTLKDISFKAEPGQVVALVGPTGAGKTTLISLIPRFYEANKGRVLLDGHDIRELTLKSLRSQISIVLQQPLLFSGSIADNIRYGRLEASMEEIMEAARAANAHDFIMNLPKKYDTQLGEGGAQLSGGERQRISIARAFLKDAPILILDEPTSSIDSRTESVILDALDRLMEGRTTFMVAHRLSTIRNADFILVLDHGQLVEQGTHEELLKNDSLYKFLYDMQRAARARRRSRSEFRALAVSAAD